MEIWALQKFGPRGLETLFCRFLRFFFLGTGVHPHPPPTTYWCQTNLKYDFWGLGTTWPHQPPKNAGWLAPWATAKGRTPWDGALPLAQGGPPPVALSTSYRGVNATSFEIFGAQVARNKGIGEKFHHSWSGRVRCVGAPGRQSDRTGLLDFFSHQNMQTSRNNHRERVTPLLTIVLSICEPVFGPFSIIYEMNTENSSVWVILMMAWPEKFFFRGGGGPKNAKNFSAFLGTI